MKNIAIFASGNGTNAQQIIEFFKKSDSIRVSVVYTNNSKAGVILRAEKLNISTVVFTRNSFYNTTEIIDSLKSNNIDLIVLAGFLWLVPQLLINSFTNKIINIHPALLPKYGGKGMYGMYVHNAIIAAGEAKSGITIHKVNEIYDNGDIIFQTYVDIEKDDTPELLANKIHLLEHKYFPKVINDYLLDLEKTK